MTSIPFCRIIMRKMHGIRDWAPEHEKMGKGVALTHDEAEKLSALLKAW